MIQALTKSQHYYGAGHRSFCFTVYDTLIDTFLPQLMACYYIISREKSLIPTIEQTLKCGKQVKEFREDSDFGHYISDQQFYAILYEL